MPDSYRLLYRATTTFSLQGAAQDPTSARRAFRLFCLLPTISVVIFYPHPTTLVLPDSAAMRIWDGGSDSPLLVRRIAG